MSGNPSGRPRKSLHDLRGLSERLADALAAPASFTDSGGKVRKGSELDRMVANIIAQAASAKPVDELRMLNLWNRWGVGGLSDRATTTLAEDIELLRSAVEAYDSMQAEEAEVTSPGELQDSEE